MFPPFDTSLARSYCMKLISQIEAGNVILKQITRLSQERAGNGLMIGALVCKEKVLFSVSGISRQLEVVHNLLDCDFEIVPPIVDDEKIADALSKNDAEIHRLTEIIKNQGNQGDSSLVQQRTALTTESLKSVFSLYKFTRFDRKSISLNSIIASHNGKLPPTGTGDCCAPRLLSYAFSHKYTPISMDEVFFGKDTKNKINLESYPPCDERCGYILPEILGVEILYRDEDIVVVNKPSMLLSVPGRTPDKQDCLVNRIRTIFPDCIEQPSVHRLDMETSGLMVYALKEEPHRNLNKQFENKIVKKEYTALLDGVLAKADGNLAPKNNQKEGHIELKFRLDPDNRPHQVYDEEFGKLGITDWKLLNVETYTNPLTGIKKPATRMLYIPLTGRTHQLRLISADQHGFHLPIIGDTLYGTCNPGERLMLHCHYLSFVHPTTGKTLEFNLKADF